MKLQNITTGCNGSLWKVDS